MRVIWLAAWLIRRRPRVEMFKSWNNWGIALAVCFALDLLSSASRTSRIGRRSAEKANEAPKPVPVGVG
jgi:hypothetical protein